MDRRARRAVLVTDERWRVLDRPVAEWQWPGFDASDWPAATVYGESPFGTNVYGYPPPEVVHVSSLGHALTEAEKALIRAREALQGGKRTALR